MKTKVAVCTSIGQKRKNNQDNFYVNGTVNDNKKEYIFKSFLKSKGEQVLAICDGMGGEMHGEIASYIAVKKLDSYNKKYSNLITRFEEHIYAYVESANKALCEYIYAHDNERMGTTLALLCISTEHNEAIAANVGDSKVFFLRGDTFLKITEDHNQAQTLVDLNVITEEEARLNPNKSILTQHLGIYPSEMVLEPYISDTIMLQANDIFLLCSDGLTDMLTNEEISECLKAKKDLDYRCKELVDKANQKGGRDNITVILAEMYE